MFFKNYFNAKKTLHGVLFIFWYTGCPGNNDTQTIVHHINVNLSYICYLRLKIYFQHNGKMFLHIEVSYHHIVCWRERFCMEAHFWPKGYVNSRNDVHWSLERPDGVLKKPLHSQVTDWLAMCYGKGTIVSFFSEEGDNTVTVNSERYIKIVLEHFLAELSRRQNVNKQRLWFQQAATPHTSKMAINWLNDHLVTRVISLNTRHIWAPNGRDLNPLDFFNWGSTKGRAYEDSLKTLDDRKAAILR